MINEENSVENEDVLEERADESPPEDDPVLPLIDSALLEESSNKIVNDIIKTDNVDELKNLTKMFNINQAKKNAVRVVKLNSLLDMVNDQAIERITKRPYEVTNKELLDYMQVVSTQVEKSQKIIDRIDEAPMIQFNQQNNSINVNVGNDALGRDSKERVIEAVTNLLKLAKLPQSRVDATIEEPLNVDISKDGKESKND